MTLAIPPAAVDASECEELMAFYCKSLHAKDLAPLVVCLATVATSEIPGDALWVFIVGPPSSAKTEVLRPFMVGPPFERPEHPALPTYSLSSLSNHALVSGLKGGKSLLPELNNKTLIVKDFTTVMEMSRDKRDEILGDLRDAYDGTYGKAFGTIGTLTFESHFNFLAAVTNAIEKTYTVMSVLGQRFLMVRTSFQAEFETDAERDIEVFRSDFKRMAHAAVESVKDGPLPDCPKPLIGEITSYAKEVSALRTHVSRDGYQRHVTSIPEPEGPMRLSNQLLKLVRGAAKVIGKQEVTSEELALARRVARDTVPSIRRTILGEILRGNETVEGLEDALGLSRPTIELILEDLAVLGAIDVDRSSKPYHLLMAQDFSIMGGDGR